MVTFYLAFELGMVRNEVTQYSKYNLGPTISVAGRLRADAECDSNTIACRV